MKAGLRDTIVGGGGFLATAVAASPTIPRNCLFRTLSIIVGLILPDQTQTQIITLKFGKSNQFEVTYRYTKGNGVQCLLQFGFIHKK